MHQSSRRRGRARDPPRAPRAAGGRALSSDRGGDRERAARSRRALTSPICCSSISGLPDGDGRRSDSRMCAAGRRCRSSCCRRARWRAQKIAALDAGADDYVTKPFSAPSCSRECARRLRRDVRGSEARRRSCESARSTWTWSGARRRGRGRPASHAARVRVLEMPRAPRRHDRTQRQLLREVWGPIPGRRYAQPARLHEEPARRSSSPIRAGRAIS